MRSRCRVRRMLRWPPAWQTSTVAWGRSCCACKRRRAPRRWAPSARGSPCGARLAMRGAFCPGSRQPAYSGGALWKGAAEVVRSSQSNGVAPVRFWQVIALHPGRAPLYVANVHLASGRHMMPEEAECSRVDDLHTLLDAEPFPHVIVGDFNEGPGGPAAAYLYGRGYEDAALLLGWICRRRASARPAAIRSGCTSRCVRARRASARCPGMHSRSRITGSHT